MSEKHCARPTLSASFQSISSTAWTRGSPCRAYQRSTAKITIAPSDEGRGDAHRVEQVGLDLRLEGEAHDGRGQEGDERGSPRSAAAAGRAPRPEKARAKRARYSQHTARMAPSWITMSKTLPFSSFRSSRSETMMRWPVEETGRNSVRPSTTPRTSAFTSGAISIGASLASARERHPPGARKRERRPAGRRSRSRRRRVRRYLRGRSSSAEPEKTKSWSCILRWQVKQGLQVRLLVHLAVRREGRGIPTRRCACRRRTPSPSPRPSPSRSGRSRRPSGSGRSASLTGSPLSSTLAL